MYRIANIYQFKDKLFGRTKLGNLFAATVMFIIIITGISAIASEVIEGDTLFFDRALLLIINSISNPALDILMLAITKLGNTIPVVFAALIAIYFFSKIHDWQSVIQIVFGIGGVVLLNFILKLIFARDRPELWTLLTYESTYSFPSGHAAVTAAAAMTAILLSWRTNLRYPILIIGSTFAFAVGLSRLYLGVHYPTDVIVGWLVGIGWVTVVATIIGAIKLPLWYTKGNG